MRNLPALAMAVAVALTAFLTTAVPRAHAATEGARPTFAATAATATLVVVGRAEVATGGAITIIIDRVLQGAGPADGRLEFHRPEAPPTITHGQRVVIAFSDPTSIDADAPTYAWPVSPDGFVDPRGVQPADGLPPTLAAMYTYFGVPMGSGYADGGIGGDVPVVLVPFLLVLAAMLLAEGGIARRGRAHRTA
ncbi:MAG TPA: hypothetical protein VFY23_15295 [Candidatus Limnocylindrales bacterium]|nr:hypothetical protein [Candidatus Limnocylindrales bacterium]